MTGRKWRYGEWLFIVGGFLSVVGHLIEAVQNGRTVKTILVGLGLALILMFGIRDVLRLKRRRALSRFEAPGE